MLWPGYHLFCTTNDYFSLYIGYGSKYHTDTFYPRFQYAIQEDFDDSNVQFEVSKIVANKIDDEIKSENAD